MAPPTTHTFQARAQGHSGFPREPTRLLHLSPAHLLNIQCSWRSRRALPMVLCSEGCLARAETLSHLISWKSCLPSLNLWLTTVTHWTRQAKPHHTQARPSCRPTLLSFALRPQWTSATFYCPQVANNRDPMAAGWRASKSRCCSAFPQRVPSAAWKIWFQLFTFPLGGP